VLEFKVCTTTPGIEIFLLSQLGMGSVTVKHLPMCRTAPTIKSYPAQNVNSTEVEKILP
jgi:hypothetical protein